MKKNMIVLFLASIFTFTSCSSDDDATANYTVEGTWNLTAMNPAPYNLDDCPEKPVISFNADNSAVWTYYDVQNDCAALTDNGTWSKDSATQYTIFVPEFGTLTGTVEFSSATKFTFSGTTQGIPFTLTFEQ